MYMREAVRSLKLVDVSRGLPANGSSSDRSGDRRSILGRRARCSGAPDSSRDGHIDRSTRLSFRGNLNSINFGAFMISVSEEEEERSLYTRVIGARGSSAYAFTHPCSSRRVCTRKGRGTEASLRTHNRSAYVYLITLYHRFPIQRYRSS